ncbi:hypothetical protein QVL97_09180 [Pseudomonas aeruginosa]|uniref:hypothetical protein n=1 Tax=Pseudomonas aeruginosa TaxID=287 RepID=UPI00352434A3
MTNANECTCPSGDGSLRHPCPAHPASVELAGVAAKLTFINGRPAMCGCQVEYSSGGGEYSDVIDVTLCAKHSGSAILDLVATNRIALTPEYEGQWHADLYLDREAPLAKAEGATPAEAVLALMSAERIDPEQESVEQAGGDELAVDGKPRATKCPDCGEGDLMPGDLCACGYETDPAAGYACSECDGSGDGCVGEVCRECDGSGWFLTPEQARAALAQPSPAPTMRAAIDVANDRFEVPVAKWGTDLAGEEERPEVVAWRYGFSGGIVSDKACLDEWKSGGEYQSLMTVAQHERIVGELRTKADQLREALEWRKENQAGQRELLRSVTAERDAALTEVERLIGVCASLDSEKRDMEHKRDAIIAMRDAALARVAELEKREPAGVPMPDEIHQMAFEEGQPADDGDGYLFSSEEFDLFVQRLLDSCAAPPAQAQHSVPEGYALIPVRETEAMHDAVMALLYKGVARTDTQKLLDAYIAAAPGKEG